MNILFYYLFSSLEYVAMFFLMFRLYRLSLAHSGWHVFLSCVLLTNADRTIRDLYRIPEFSPVIQLLLLFFLVWLLFHIHPFYASIVSVTGYMAYVSIANFWITSLPLFGIINMSALNDPGSLDNRMLQCITAFSALAVAWLIQAKGWRFNFIPDDMTARVRPTLTNQIVVANLLLSGGIVAAGYYSLFTNADFPFIIICAAFWAMLSLLIYLSKKKNEE